MNARIEEPRILKGCHMQGFESLVDARTMDREVAVIPLKNHIPFGFHGWYVPEVFI